MTSQTLDVEGRTSGQHTASSLEIFATVQQLSSQINEDHMSQVVNSIKGLAAEDSQLVIDLLSVTLEKYHHLLMDADRTFQLLLRIAKSMNIIAHNRTLDSEHLTSDIEASPDVYLVQGEPPSRVRVIKRGKENTPGIIHVAWAHLSHPNIFPVYGAFLDGKDGPVSLVSPWLNMQNIVDHAKILPQTRRVLLISDVIDGLCYLHELNIAHGALIPQRVLISDSGRALITDLDASPVTSAIRYSAPEVLENDDTRPTKAADIWAFGCLCYEVLSGNIPYCQYHREGKVALIVIKGEQPTRPGQEGVEGEKIDDVTWRPVSACWKFDAKARPSCWKLHDIFSNLDIHDDRPLSEPMIQPVALREIEVPVIGLESMRSLLNRLLATDNLLPPPSQIPESLREPLSGLADYSVKAKTIAAIVKRLKRDEIQNLVDALDLVLEANPSSSNSVVQLLSILMASTRVFPQCYRLHRIRSDPTHIAEGTFGRTYKCRKLDICVNAVTNVRYVTNIVKFLAHWARSSHPNILPFYGVFNESVNNIPQFCVVSPYMRNGTLYDYAPRLPQKSRIPLISDVIKGLDYLHEHAFHYDGLRPDNVLISDEGRALIATFNTAGVVTCTPTTNAVLSSASYTMRFQAPEMLKAGRGSNETDIWSFGCLCYQALSRKLPYHRLTEKNEVEFAVSRGEPPERPTSTNDSIDAIDYQLWDLIQGCCRQEPGDRLTTTEIQDRLANMRIQDDRPDVQKLPGHAIFSLRNRPYFKWGRIEQLLNQIQAELLQNSLLKLLQNRMKDVAAEAVKLQRNDIQTFVDFLDVTIKNHHTMADDRNRVLALLSRIMTLAQVFPQRHELKGIKYDPTPIAEGGFGKVHRGHSDPTICVKVMIRVNDRRGLIAYIRELIVWAHLSHKNVLPFYGAFFDESQQICLVSPYMTKGNLCDYTRKLPQESRILLLLDTIKGLNYLHGLGVVHTDLKGENVLISDEGRGLITDFGASHIITATAKGGATANTFVATTLRFTAPEIIQNQTGGVRLSKECDIWSFGCLSYQILSRKLPYYEYRVDAQVFAALFRGQPPRRPGLSKNDGRNDNDDDEDDDDWNQAPEKDWDDLDDTAWGLVSKCLVPKPNDRPNASRIQELIINMKVPDSRPATEGVPGAAILKQKSNVKVNLNHAGALLDHLQILFLARSMYKHPVQEVVAAVSKLDHADADNLIRFCSLALKDHLSTSGDRSRLLAINSAFVVSRRSYPTGYFLRTRPQYHPKIVGEGSFGRVYQWSAQKICIKAANFSQTIPDFENQWARAWVPWAHLSHPNILPFYGVYIRGRGFVVTPFIGNGNLHTYAPSLSQTSRMLLVADVVEGLMYLHEVGIIHGNLKTQNVLISDQGRGLITDFRPYQVNIAAVGNGPTGSFITSTLRFTAPELVKNSVLLPNAASDVWSVGCLIYEVLSKNVPYHKYIQDSLIRSALSRGELPIRPISADGNTDQIDDRPWDLIKRCCALDPLSRLKLADIRSWLRNANMEDNRPATSPFPTPEVLKQRYPLTEVDILHVGEILDKILVDITRRRNIEFYVGCLLIFLLFISVVKLLS